MVQSASPVQWQNDLKPVTAADGNYERQLICWSVQASAHDRRQ